ncbi:MAG: sulfotransferase [Idiomarinaceae bacterium]|uniref:sulfotransferase n=1 Tax=Idiomarina sp. 28-8 TaxID=1260624 RepID=UPI0002D3B632|nr:sulfotransferase [Idiomarina sp. 28-8]NWO01546.1 sulfotransferase [Idiomarinaceae bacterium]
MDKRQSRAVRIARLIQKLPLRLLRVFEWPFLLFANMNKDTTPAIFIFALPRSGSTLTYQSICHGLSVNYLSNIWNLLYQLPILGGYLSSKRASHHKSDFTSQHGFVSGIDGPAEGMVFWSWWLGCDLSEDLKSTPSLKKMNKRAKYLRKVVTFFGNRKAPFITAYLGHSLVPDRVDNAFPGSVFIRLHREPVANALSILKSLRQGESSWFSVKPKECEGAEKESEHFAVASQVYWLNKRLDDAECSNKMLSISYEALCENPCKEIARVVEACEKHGLSISKKFPLPDKFSYKKADLNADYDAIKIKKELDKLESKYGKLREITRSH